MNRRLLSVAATILAGTPSQSDAQVQSPRFTVSDTLVIGRRLDSLMTSIRSDSGPGCVVGIRRGGLTLVRSAGFADLESRRPIDSATVFEAGSVSKQVTAAAMVLLARRGTLSLDDPVRRWIPELAPSLPPITLRQLLHHQSGLREWSDLVAVTGWPRGTREYTMPAMVALLARQQGTNFAPGREYLYSNSNYLLAAEVVARASGQSFADFTRAALFAPLGMAHTSWRADFRMRVPGRATAWSRGSDGAWQLDMPFESVIGPGGLLTTVPDLLRWNAGLAGALFAPSLVLEMERAGITSVGRNTGYGLGLELSAADGERIVSHAGSTAGYRAFAGRVPGRGADVAMLCNDGTLNTEELGPVLLSIAAGLSSPAAAALPALGASSTAGADAARAGLYRNDRTGQTVVMRVFDEGVSLNTWVGFRRRGASYVSMEGDRTLAFTPDAPSFHVASGGDTVRYSKVVAWAPSRAELAAIAGRYASEETDARWTIRVQRDSLRVSLREGVEHVLVPIYRDAFRVPDEGWLVSVVRDRAGRAVGLRMSSGRTRGLPFVRIPSTQ